MCRKFTKFSHRCRLRSCLVFVTHVLRQGDLGQIVHLGHGTISAAHRLDKRKKTSGTFRPLDGSFMAALWQLMAALWQLYGSLWEFMVVLW